MVLTINILIIKMIYVDAIAHIKEQKARKAIEEARAQESQNVSTYEQGDVNKVGTLNNNVIDEKRLDDSASKKSPNSTSNNGQTNSKQSSTGGGKQNMKPVSTTAVPGTPWCVVWTDKNRVFYFNPSTKTSVWDRPIELRGREDVDKMVSNPPPILNTSSQQSTNSSSSSTAQNATPVVGINDDNNSHHSFTGDTNSQSQTSHEAKKIKLDNSNDSSTISDTPTTTTTTTSTTASATIKTSLTIAPKVIKKDVVSEVEKEAAKKRETVPYEERVETFTKMLEEKEVNPMSTFQKELSKIVFDPRYLLLTSSQRREVFDKYCADKTEEEQKRRREKIKLTTTQFRALLAEANLTSRSTFDEFHAQFSKDERYKALEKTKDREILFDDHLAYLRRKEREERSQHQQQQQQQQPQQSSHHHHHHQHHNSHHHNDRRSHSRHRSSSRSVPRDEAEGLFHALLIELITDPDVSWHDAKRIMRKSAQWDLVNDLPRDWMEVVFDCHLDKIYQRRREKFHQLLGETKEITLGHEWRDVKRIIRDDPRYIKFCNSDRRGEREFREFIKKKRSIAEDNFKQLLRETTLIDKSTRQKIEESEHQHLIDIISALQNDKRYTDLEPLSEDRRKILLSYIEELAEK